jgi:hypothetical protein
MKRESVLLTVLKHLLLARHAYAFSLFVTLLFTSCASVSVDNVRQLADKSPTLAPKEILILPFEIPKEVMRVDRDGKELETFQRELKAMMTRELGVRLKEHVAPTRIIKNTDALPTGNYWMLTGKFIRVNQGSRLLRSTVGFGAGGTKMETNVALYDLSGPVPKKFLQFETTGGSNISQGIGGVITIPMSGPMALTSLFNAVEGVVSGVTFDTQRTAREITATLSEYLHHRDALKGKQRLRPKRLGEIPTLLPSNTATPASP